VLALAREILDSARTDRTRLVFRREETHHKFTLARGVVLHLSWNKKLIRIELDEAEWDQRSRELAIVGGRVNGESTPAKPKVEPLASETLIFSSSTLRALTDADDHQHQQAKRLFVDIVDRKLRKLTTSYVAIDYLAWVRGRFGVSRARESAAWLKEVIPLVEVDIATHWDAWSLLNDEPALSDFGDATCVVLARRINRPVFCLGDTSALMKCGAAVYPAVGIERLTERATIQ
jgi:predicted nucleic acid-binding protein